MLTGAQWPDRTVSKSLRHGFSSCCWSWELTRPLWHDLIAREFPMAVPRLLPASSTDDSMIAWSTAGEFLCDGYPPVTSVDACPMPWDHSRLVSPLQVPCLLPLPNANGCSISWSGSWWDLTWPVRPLATVSSTDESSMILQLVRFSITVLPPATRSECWYESDCLI